MLSFFMIGSSVAVCLQCYLDQAKRRIASSLWEPREGIALMVAAYGKRVRFASIA
jgi:hypothetical protein